MTATRRTTFPTGVCSLDCYRDSMLSDGIQAGIQPPLRADAGGSRLTIFGFRSHMALRRLHRIESPTLIEHLDYETMNTKSRTSASTVSPNTTSSANCTPTVGVLEQSTVPQDGGSQPQIQTRVNCLCKLGHPVTSFGSYCTFH